MPNHKSLPAYLDLVQTWIETREWSSADARQAAHDDLARLRGAEAAGDRNAINHYSSVMKHRLIRDFFYERARRS